MRIYDTTPKPAFLRAMQSQKWTVAGALAELVDNSFGSGRGNASEVHIIHDTARRTLTVIDNGQGMEAIGRLFQLGNTIGRSPGDIGFYGSGGTMAILWLSRKVEVWTLKNGMISTDRVVWAEEIKAERFPIISDEWTVSTPGNTPARLFDFGHGTMIRIDLANERAVFHPQNVRRDLARMYAPALRLGKRIKWTTVGKNSGTSDFLADPIILPSDAKTTIPIQFSIDLDGSHLSAKGLVGIAQEIPLEQSKVNIGFGPRVIDRTRDCYSSPDGAERYTGAGVTGWIDLDDGWRGYLTTTKDGINDSRAYDALMAHIFEQIKPLLSSLEDERFQIVMDDIALMLSTLLDGKAHVDIPVRTAEESEEENDTPGTGGPVKSPDPHDKPKDGPTEPRPAISRIDVVSLDDASMGGILCRADVTDKGADVFVNKDHSIVREAMIKKPVNRTLLEWMVVREIATQLVDNDAIAKRVFPPRALRQLEDTSGRHREGLITRMLLDRVKH